MNAKQDDAGRAVDADDISPAELQAFLEGDGLEDEARPEFKAELRRRLWDLVQRQLPGNDAQTRGNGTDAS